MSYSTQANSRLIYVAGSEVCTHTRSASIRLTNWSNQQGPVAAVVVAGVSVAFHSLHAKQAA